MQNWSVIPLGAGLVCVFVVFFFKVTPKKKSNSNTNEPICEPEIESGTQKMWWLPGWRRVAEGWIGSLELAHANWYV